MHLDFKSFGCGMVIGAGLVLVPVGLFFGWAYRRAVAKREAQHTFQLTVTNPGAAVGDGTITGLLQPIRQQYALPGVAAAIVTGGETPRVGAVGVLKKGTDAPVRLDCRWHLGSDTKAMTSTLIARFVEQHRLNWDTTLAEVFPDLAAGMHPAFRTVTVRHLLSHRAGLPPNLDSARFATGDVQALRLRAVREETAKPPRSEPGSSYVYSNLGYIIAGAVVERITGQSWEQAITQEIFTPLHMDSAGFGGTGTPGQIDQPWPHTADGVPAAENGPAADNPPVFGPVGRVHCTVQDWARFVQDQLRGDRGEPALLSPGSYQELHTAAFGGDYALGWITATRSWGGGKVLNHVGDNTMNCANVWVAPRRNFAILVCTNQGGEQAFKGMDAAVGALLKTLPGGR